MKDVDNLLNELLHIELVSNAAKLRLVTLESPIQLSEELLSRAITILNDLSIEKDSTSKKQLIAICALLWTYRLPSWEGLKEYLILFLSRAGFGPSSIMVDRDYSSSTQTFSPLGSILNQFSVALEQLTYEIKIADKIFLLSDFQKDLWDAIDVNQLLGISAPTSAGKSFLILLKAIDLVQQKRGPIIYVVPTLSLVSQVISDFRRMLDTFGMSDFSLESTFNIEHTSDSSIYVLTQEKAIAAFSQADTPFTYIRLLVIDEIQNVERVIDNEDRRSKVLYDLMIELRNTAKIDHIIISGPRILKIDQLATNVFDLSSDKRETDSSPVLNLTYSIDRKKEKYSLSLFSDLLEQNPSIEITNPDTIRGYGKVLYDEEFLNYLQSFLEGFGENEGTIIFSPNPGMASRTAVHLSIKRQERSSAYLDGLSAFIASTVHPKLSLVETVKKGIAYHHGKLPFHTRLLVEDGIKKKELTTVVCTTTLLQGVNLPVQNIIIRNPNLFVTRKKDSVSLTNYEIANLRGRAGRLLKDFIGRTFILDELSFKEKDSQPLDLFAGSSKELAVGYGDAYIRYKDNIQKDINEGVGSTIDNQDYSYLLTYIRQAAIRYGISTGTYLSRVGIIISDSELNNVLESILRLEVSRETCIKNRYWDPIDLNRLSVMAHQFVVPINVTQANISYILKEVLIKLRAQFPTYYKKYFGINEGKKDILLQKCILAENWLKEKTLFDIFNDAYYSSSEIIDETMSDLQGKVSYGLPLLLKPLYDIKRSDGMFTRFIELGAFKPLTRRLIELSIPRETAIFLSNNFSFDNIDDKTALINRIRNIRENLTYWHQVQLSSL